MSHLVPIKLIKVSILMTTVCTGAGRFGAGGLGKDLFACNITLIRYFSPAPWANGIGAHPRLDPVDTGQGQGRCCCAKTLSSSARWRSMLLYAEIDMTVLFCDVVLTTS